MSTGRSVFSWLLTPLALIPLGLIPLAGFFSRMKIDDFCVIADAKQYDAWGAMLHFFNGWSGSYTRFFLIGLLGPLDHMATAIAPLIIVTLWFCSLSWLVYEGLICLGLKTPRLAIAIALSALTVAATVFAFPSERAMYWYVANTAYALPFAPLCAFLALSVRVGRQGAVSRRALIAGAIICFLSAGLAEAFVVFQLCFLACCLFLAIASKRGAARLSILRMLAAGWLASLVSLGVQLLSPGVMKRSLAVAQDARLPPVRSLAGLATGTVDNTFAFLSDPEITSGFLLLAAVGMLVVLAARDLPAMKPEERPARLYAPLLWLGLGVQLLSVPILWAYVSDDPQFLGRFSIRFMPFILFNILALIVYALLLWQRVPVNARLNQYGPRMRSAFNALLVIVSTMLALEMTAVRIYAWFYFLVTIVLILASFLWESVDDASNFWPRRASFLLILCLTITWFCQASVAFTLLFARGEVFIRTMTAGPALMMMSGLIWGALLGYWINGFYQASAAKGLWHALLKIGLFAAILFMGSAMVRSQIELVGLYQDHARQWDAKHTKILALRESGETRIVIEPMPRSFGNYMSGRHAICYYGVPVTVAEDP